MFWRENYFLLGRSIEILRKFWCWVYLWEYNVMLLEGSSDFFKKKWLVKKVILVIVFMC